MAMRTDLAPRHAQAVEAARRAGAHLLTLFDRRFDLVVEEKGANDFVSRADREAEALIRAAVREHFPHDGFIGEESGASPNLAAAAAIWVVDPLDGTTNFLRGNPNWCVSIGVLVEGQPAIGVVFDPIRDELFESVAGGGARLNGTALDVGIAADPASASVGLGFVKRVGAATFCADTERLLSHGLSFRQVGAGALMLAYVAAGRIDSYFERHMWPWDALGGLALIREAGGHALPYPGTADLAAGGLVLAAGPNLYGPLRDMLDLS